MTNETTSVGMMLPPAADTAPIEKSSRDRGDTRNRDARHKRAKKKRLESQEDGEDEHGPEESDGPPKRRGGVLDIRA